MASKLQGALDRWLARWGWKLLLIAMTVTALVRAWLMWRQLPRQ